MNKTLKFSWGHIVAILTLLFLTYTIFIGEVYLNDGNFELAILWTGVFFLSTALLFGSLQMLKATDKKFRRRIKMERVLLLLSTGIFFFFLMAPFFHFWSLRSQNDEIVANFDKTLSKSKQIFDKYQTYCDDRIAKFDDLTTKASTTKSTDELAWAGFCGANLSLDRANLLTGLKLHLLSDNFYNLKKSAVEWIDNSNRDVSIWNVFIIGNIKQIERSIEGWYNRLIEISHTTRSESQLGGVAVKGFDNNRVILSSISGEFKKISDSYTSKQIFSFWGPLLAILFYLLLLLPYIFQSRHTRSRESLLGDPNSTNRTNRPKKSARTGNDDDGKEFSF